MAAREGGMAGEILSWNIQMIAMTTMTATQQGRFSQAPRQLLGLANKYQWELPR